VNTIDVPRPSRTMRAKLSQIDREEKPDRPRYRFARPATFGKLRPSPPDNASKLDAVSCITTVL
jgi:hypothetical protein